MASPSPVPFCPCRGRGLFCKTAPRSCEAAAGDTDTGIFDRDKDLSVPECGFDGDGGIAVAEFDCVVDEVVEYLVDFGRVRLYRQRGFGQTQIKRQALFLAPPLKGEDGAADLLIDIKGAEIQINAAGAVFVQLQQTLGQFFQAFRLKYNDVEILLLHPGGDCPVRHSLRVTLDGSQGRAEIVGNIGNEFSLVLFERVQFMRHEIHDIGQKASSSSCCTGIGVSYAPSA